jgi:hypothetical protein
MPDALPDKPKRGQRERRLLSEWLALRYPDQETWQQVRLGAFQQTIANAQLDITELRALGVWRRYADALVFKESSLLLIEASLVSEPGYISQIELYARLIPLTPELEVFWAWPIEMLYLVALEDPVVTANARDRGIRIEVFTPIWIPDYFAGLEKRKSVATRSGGL